MNAIQLAIDQLLLDSENPRVGTTANQREALQKVLDDQEVKLFNLAESIVNDGLSPIEIIMVMREKKGSDRFVSLEGNRRVAALKILVNPHQLADLKIKDSLQKRFEKLASRFDRSNVEPILCTESKGRDEAAPWLYRRHVGEDSGRGLVTWSGIAAARFRGRDPALQALDLVIRHGNLSDELRAAIADSFPITTLERLLDSLEVRKLLGFEVADRKLRSGLPADELLKPLKRMVLDLLGREITVTDVKSVAQQVEYVKKFPPSDRPNLSKAGKVRAVDEILGKEFPASAASASQRKARHSDPSQRRTIVPPRIRLNFGNNNRPAAIFNELKKLRAEDLPNAGAVLLRVFLELSVDCYLDRSNVSLRFKTPQGKMVNKELRQKVKETIDHLVTHGQCDRRHFANVVRGLSVDHSPLSINLLHDYVHNRFVTPKPKDLLRAWNDAQQFFEQVWA